MPVVILRLGEKNPKNGSRPHQCPQCGSQILHKWGSEERVLKDVNQSVAQVHRYRCSSCNHTFRFYPSGSDRSNISRRVRRMAAIAWALGMSSREVVEFFHQFDIHLSHSTVWRDAHRLLKQQGDGQDSRRFNLDSRFLPGVSTRLGVVVAVDMGAGRLAVLGTVDEYNPRKVISQLTNLVGDVVDVVTTETKSLYRALAQAVSPPNI